MPYSPLSYRNVVHATEPVQELNTLLAPKDSGYIGADIGMSIPLSDKRVLWIFGDTLVGRMDKGSKKREFHAMPRNTVAIQHPGIVSPENIEWVFTDRQGTPKTFFTLPPEIKDQWFWPCAGAVIENELFIFGYNVMHAEGVCEALSFRTLGMWLMRIRDVSRHPHDWKIEARAVIHPLKHTFFSSACYFEHPYLYLMGVSFISNSYIMRQTNAVLGRVKLDDLRREGEPCVVEYIAEKKGAIYWTKDANKAAALYRPGVSECSVLYDAPRKRFIATTYQPNTPNFFVITAPSITGPWNNLSLIFTEQTSRPVQKHLYYALRMHPHLTAHENEMIMTYVVNTRSVADLLVNPDLYYPHFLRVDLSKI